MKFIVTFGFFAIRIDGKFLEQPFLLIFVCRERNDELPFPPMNS